MILCVRHGRFHEISKFIETQIAFVLKQVKDWTVVADICRMAEE
jgi:hypothetical protein